MASPTGTTRTGDDALKTVVESLVAVGKADFGQRWNSQFSGDEDLRQWKRRAYSQLRGMESTAIVDGYERAKVERSPHVPCLAEIVTAAKAESLKAKRVSDQIEYVNAPKIPAGSGLSGYVEYLDAHAEGDIARGCIAMMREIVARLPAATREEQNARLDKALSAHDKLLAMAPIRPRAYGERRECGKTGCSEPGTLSHATNGEGPWFCNEHWRG